MKKINLIICIIFFQISISAQLKMTLMEAISVALKNNHELLISKNMEMISSNNNSYGNAGYYPSLSFNSAANFNLTNTKQHFTNDTKVDKNNVTSNGVNAGLNLDWTLYDGKKRVARKEALAKIYELNKIFTDITVENTITQVIYAYYNIVKQKQIIEGLRATKAVVNERKKLVELKLSIGSGNSQDVLQAKMDENSLQADMLIQQNLLLNYKSSLNEILSIPIEEDIEVETEFTIDIHGAYSELKEKLKSNNLELVIAQKNIELVSIQLKELEGNRLPSLSLHSGYQFSRNNTSAGFSLLNQNLGLYTGLSLNWLLFNGYQNRTGIKNKILESLNTKYQYESKALTLNRSLYHAYQNFQNQIELIQLFEANAILGKENIEISMERFKQGHSTALELKEAERSQQDVINKLAIARFNAKISETELRKLIHSPF